MPITDRACYFGDGVYDVAYCNSGIMYAADEHLGRFFRSCEAIGIKLPYTKEELYAIFNKFAGTKRRFGGYDKKSEK